MQKMIVRRLRLRLLLLAGVLLLFALRELVPGLQDVALTLPAANRKVMAIRTRRFWKELAKYAGSMTEIQQGAKSAMPSAMKAAKTEPPKKMLDSKMLCVV